VILSNSPFTKKWDNMTGEDMNDLLEYDIVFSFTWIWLGEIFIDSTSSSNFTTLSKEILTQHLKIIRLNSYHWIVI
jgi:hypothetical protein